MIKIEVKPTLESQAWIDSLPNNVKQGLYKGIADAMSFVETEAKQSFGKSGNLNVRTGNLRRSIVASSKKLEGSLESSAEYAAIHEFGGTIKPKNSKYLKFVIGGQWKSVKQVIMPARPFLMPAFEDNMDDISNIIINKIFEEI